MLINKIYNCFISYRPTNLGVIIACKEGPTIPPGPGRRVVWNGYLDVPYIVPTGLGADKCKYIDVQYVFLV